jgi:hypothetical protein
LNGTFSCKGVAVPKGRTVTTRNLQFRLRTDGEVAELAKQAHQLCELADQLFARAEGLRASAEQLAASAGIRVPLSSVK